MACIPDAPRRRPRYLQRESSWLEEENRKKITGEKIEKQFLMLRKDPTGIFNAKARGCSKKETVEKRKKFTVAAFAKAPGCRRYARTHYISELEKQHIRT